jgi:hypothetical protein
MASASDAQVSEWQASNRMDHQIARSLPYGHKVRKREHRCRRMPSSSGSLISYQAPAATSEPRTSWSGWERSALATDLTTLPDFQDS